MESASPRTIPRANRLHLVLMGNRNSGKSSLLNALTAQSLSIVSPVPGTTTDCVYKSFEWPEIGPIVFIDTAGIDEDRNDALGQKRVQESYQALKQADFVLLLYSACQEWEGAPREHFLSLLNQIRSAQIPFLVVLTQVDALSASATLQLRNCLLETTSLSPSDLCLVSSQTQEGIEPLRLLCTQKLKPLMQSNQQNRITAGLVEKGDFVVLVMPQDRSAPQGRLIQAQSQTIRELLDIGAITLSVAPEQLESLQTLRDLNPKLVICDSQVFKETKQKIGSWPLTSFSILFAAYKSDLNLCIQGIDALAHLHAGSKILIAEACSHQPLNEDIGRVKIPTLLRKRFGETLTIDFINGADLPDASTLRSYDLIIQCGGCMFTRTHMLERTKTFANLGIPLCNYGLALAWLQGVWDDIVLPHN